MSCGSLQFLSKMPKQKTRLRRKCFYTSDLCGESCFRVQSLSGKTPTCMLRLAELMRPEKQAATKSLSRGCADLCRLKMLFSGFQSHPRCRILHCHAAATAALPTGTTAACALHYKILQWWLIKVLKVEFWGCGVGFGVDA